MNDSFRDLKANFGRINLSPPEARGFDYKREYSIALKWFFPNAIAFFVNRTEPYWR